LSSLLTHTEDQPDASAPIDMLEHYFASHRWAFDRAGDDEIVATVKGSWTDYELRAMWREDERVLQFVGLTGISLPDKAEGATRAAVYEVLGLVNEQLWLGHFELWSADGTILFRHAMLVDGDGGEPALSLAQVEALVDAAIDECERYYPVFQFVLWGGKKPAEALAAALLDTMGEA
jgi:hypothetical protein